MLRSLFLLHKYAALLTGIFLALLGVTGSILAFEGELSDVIYPTRIARGTSQLPLADQINIVRRTFPGEAIFGARLGGVDRATTVLLDSRQVFIDGSTGEVLGERTRAGALSVLHRFHANLLVPGGRNAVAVCAFALVILSVTGLVVWWRVRQFPIVRPPSWRTHSVLGAWSNLYLLLLGVSSILIALPVNALIYRVTGSQPANRPVRMSTPQTGATSISPDRAAQIAAAALPDLPPETVILPFSKTAPYRIGMRTASSTLLAGDVQIDQYSGAILAADRVNYSDPAMRIIQGNRSFHTGCWLGVPGKILAALAGLVMAAQAITGFVMWRRSVRRRATYREPEPVAQSLR